MNSLAIRIKKSCLTCIAPLAALALIFSFSPQSASARNLTEPEKIDIAEKLTALLPALQVTYTGSPVIVGDPAPLVFKITPSGKPGFGTLFLSGRYDIIHRPDNTFNLGSYLCYLGQEFVRARRSQNSNFLPKFDVTIPVKYMDIGFEIKADQETIADIVYGILYLWDVTTEANYGHFRILVRGSADEGGQFVGTMLQDHPINKVVFLPPAQPDPLLFYQPAPQEKAIADPFGNADLPNLRATFVKEIIDAFLQSCAVQSNLAVSSTVINGSVFSGRNVDYRSIEIFFYAYR